MNAINKHFLHIYSTYSSTFANKISIFKASTFFISVVFAIIKQLRKVKRIIEFISYLANVFGVNAVITSNDRKVKYGNVPAYYHN